MIYRLSIEWSFILVPYHRRKTYAVYYLRKKIYIIYCRKFDDTMQVKGATFLCWADTDAVPGFRLFTWVTYQIFLCHTANINRRYNKSYLNADAYQERT